MPHRRLTLARRTVALTWHNKPAKLHRAQPVIQLLIRCFAPMSKTGNPDKLMQPEHLIGLRTKATKPEIELHRGSIRQGVADRSSVPHHQPPYDGASSKHGTRCHKPLLVANLGCGTRRDRRFVSSAGYSSGSCSTAAKITERWNSGLTIKRLKDRMISLVVGRPLVDVRRVRFEGSTYIDQTVVIPRQSNLTSGSHSLDTGRRNELGRHCSEVQNCPTSQPFSHHRSR